MPEKKYPVKLITNPAVALPGALDVGPFRFGSYGHYWNEVANLEGHRARLEEYRREADDAPRSLAAFREQRAKDHEAFVEALERSQADVAARYDQAIEEGDDVDGLTTLRAMNQPPGAKAAQIPTPAVHDAHARARKG